MPKVSIIMNCLNCARDLPQALESVRSQTLQDFEIIFWDNASTDDSAKIAQAFGPQLKYFKSDKTIPLGAARNLAIEKASGDYIAFLDCDDLWKPAKLEKEVNLFLNNPRLGLVTTDTEIFDGKHTLSRVFQASTPMRGKVFSDLLKNQWISMSSAMISRGALTDLLKRENGGEWFDERLNLCEEADLFYRIAHDWELDFVNEPLTLWRVHGKNTTFQKFGEFARETRMILEKHRKLYADYDEKHQDLVKLLEKRATFQEAIALWREGKNSEARKKIAPLLNISAKYKLFWLASFLPGSSFDLLSRMYFMLPSKFRH